MFVFKFGQGACSAFNIADWLNAVMFCNMYEDNRTLTRAGSNRIDVKILRHHIVTGIIHSLNFLYTANLIIFFRI